MQPAGREVGGSGQAVPTPTEKYQSHGPAWVRGRQMCSGMETEARETWAWQSSGLALLGANVTGDASGSQSPAFQRQDGHHSL